MKTILKAFIFLMLSTLAVAQTGGRYGNTVFVNLGYPNPNVTVCIEPATGVPCTPLAQIYSDVNLTQPLPNPFVGDSLGNFAFYAAPGLYHVQISGQNIQEYDIPYVSINAGLVAAGSTNQIQVNNAGLLAAYPSLTYTPATGILNAPTFQASQQPQLYLYSSPNGTCASPGPGFTALCVAADGNLAVNVLNSSVFFDLPPMQFGTCIMSSSTSCTATKVAFVNSPSRCFATDSATSSQVVASCAISGTTVTVSAASSNSHTFWFFVVGSPN